MNEILGIIIVMAIVSTLLLSFQQANFNFHQDSNKYNESYAIQREADIFRHQIRDLIINAGYGMDAVMPNPIIQAQSNKLVFWQKNDLGNTIKVEISTRNFPVDPTFNPNDFQIIQKTNDVYITDFGLMGLTDFSFSYYDKYHNLLSLPVANTKSIKIIAFEYTIQGREPFSGRSNEIAETDYSATSGKEIIFSKNLFDWNVSGG